MQAPLPLPLTKEIVLIGGGHTHALLLRRWGVAPLPGVRLSVINPAATAPYTGMLPGFVAGHYARGALEIDLVRLARFADARIIFGRVEGIDLADRSLSVAGRPPIPYDIASLDIGVTSDMPEVPGFSDHAIAAKPLGAFADRWIRHLAEGKGPVTVIGGGVAGVELALAMRFALGEKGEIRVIEAAEALRGISASARDRLRREMEDQGVTLIEGAGLAEVGPENISLTDGRTLPSTLTVGAAGARPFDWLQDTGLELTDGYVTVDASLRSSDPAIFAVGDCAQLTASPRPKAGVFAVRAAPVLTDNLKAAVAGRRLKPFRPQSHYLKLISLGRKAAVADKRGRAVDGDWVWRWKHWIDSRFMAKLNDLPRMRRPAVPRHAAEGMAEALGPQPLCGGCGAKIGPAVLASVLSELPRLARPDVETGPGDDAAVLSFGDTRQVVTTDHLRAFWLDPYVFAQIAAVHALGDIWAMGAAPQSALVQITLPPLATAMQQKWLAEVMAAANEVFRGAGAAIVGGHSSIGAELVLGYSVTGLTKHPLTLSGAKEGDKLLLTRPIGSGVLLAAEMQRRAAGDDIAAALAVMAAPQGDAARRLAEYAHAMTDVTGFGLAGHLARLADASRLTAVVTLDHVSVFAGAEAMARAGVRSSIWEHNRQAVAIEQPQGAQADLLFDPQTAGGLLAALPESAAAAVLDEVRAMGHDAALIGEFKTQSEVSLRLL